MTTIVVELPAHHKGLADAVRAASAELLRAEERSALGRSLDLVPIEEVAADAAARLEREMLAGVLRRLDVDADRVVIGGRPHVRVGRYPMTYYGMPGAVVVERSLFRPVGERNSDTVDPIVIRGGLVGGAWLPAAARAMASRIAIGTSREAEQTSVLEKRLPYSRTSFEDVAHLVGEAVVKKREEIEEALIEKTAIPAGTASVGIGLDRSAMAFEEPRKRPRGRPRKGAPKRPIKRVFHMAWSGTVTFHDAEGAVLDTIHYGRRPDLGDMLAESLVSDVLAIRAKRPKLPIVVLCDGAHELWNMLEEHLVDVNDVTFTVDFWHLVQKLSAAASIIGGADALLSRWKIDLLNRAQAAEEILDELHASGKEYVAVGDKHPVHGIRPAKYVLAAPPRRGSRARGGGAWRGSRGPRGRVASRGGRRVGCPARSSRRVRA